MLPSLITGPAHFSAPWTTSQLCRPGHLPSPLGTSVSSSVKWCYSFRIPKVMRRLRNETEARSKLGTWAPLKTGVTLAVIRVVRYILQSPLSLALPVPFQVDTSGQLRSAGGTAGPREGPTSAPEGFAVGHCSSKQPCAGGEAGLDELARDRVDTFPPTSPLSPSGSRSQTSVLDLRARLF